MIVAIRGLRKPHEAWGLYGRLIDAGLQVRQPDKVRFGDSEVEADFYRIVEEAQDRWVRTRRK